MPDLTPAALAALDQALADYNTTVDEIIRRNAGTYPDGPARHAADLAITLRAYYLAPDLAAIAAVALLRLAQPPAAPASDLDAVQQRHDRYRDRLDRGATSWIAAAQACADDVPALLAEIGPLRVELAAVRQMLDVATAAQQDEGEPS